MGQLNHPLHGKVSERLLELTKTNALANGIVSNLEQILKSNREDLLYNIINDLALQLIKAESDNLDILMKRGKFGVPPSITVHYDSLPVDLQESLKKAKFKVH